MTLSKEAQSDLLERGFSRRHFGRVLSLLTAGAAMPFYNEGSMAHAQLSRIAGGLPPGAVKINSNENPAGPSAAALEALIKVAKDGGRYQYEETYSMLEDAATAEGLTSDNIIPYAGSSLGLHHGVMAFVSPQRGLVTVDPGYEAAARAAEAVGAPVTRVPLLQGSFAHDIKAMAAAANKTNAGLIYVCNPNNPTGTVTPRKEVEWLLKNKPAGSIVLLDEAYLHFTDEPFGSDLIAKGEDVMVLRTFSKIYGMAGLRAGFAMAKPEILAKMKIWSSGAMPVTGMAAAHASILDKELIPTRKKATAAIRNDVMSFLDKMGYEYTPSVSNKLMIDVRMPVRDFISAMAAENIFVGRPWPAWPTWNRVSMGTEEEMGKFKVAFEKVMQS